LGEGRGLALVAAVEAAVVPAVVAAVEAAVVPALHPLPSLLVWWLPRYPPVSLLPSLTSTGCRDRFATDSACRSLVLRPAAGLVELKGQSQECSDRRALHALGPASRAADSFPHSLGGGIRQHAPKCCQGGSAPPSPDTTRSQERGNAAATAVRGVGAAVTLLGLDPFLP
jgi:hypothetical protein